MGRKPKRALNVTGPPFQRHYRASTSRNKEIPEQTKTVGAQELMDVIELERTRVKLSKLPCLFGEWTNGQLLIRCGHASRRGARLDRFTPHLSSQLLRSSHKGFGLFRIPEEKELAHVPTLDSKKADRPHHETRPCNPACSPFLLSKVRTTPNHLTKERSGLPRRQFNVPAKIAVPSNFSSALHPVSASMQAELPRNAEPNPPPAFSSLFSPFRLTFSNRTVYINLLDYNQ